jgi:ribosomal protein S6
MENELKELDAVGTDPKVYEVGYHIIPTVGDERVGAEVTAVKDIIEGAKGVIFAEEFPKQIDLAYPMTRVRQNKRATFHSAYFGWMKFEATPEAAVAIDKKLKENDQILRFILIKTVRENTMVPKKMLRERKEEILRGEEPVEPKKEELKMSEAEIDKTIEELVIS